MKKVLIIGFVLMALVVGCGTMYSDPAVEEQPIMQMNINATRPTATPTVYVTETPDPFLSVSIRQTEVEVERQTLNNEAAELNLQLTADSATSVAYAVQTQTQRAEAGLAIQMTAGVPLTQMAGTATSVAATRTADIEKQQYNAKVFGIWLGKFAWAVFLVAFLAVLIYGGYLVVKVYHFKSSQIKPDENGRYPLVPEGSIPGKNKVLLNSNLAHRSVIHSGEDGLTTEQALANTQSARHLEATREIAKSPVLARKMVKQLMYETKDLANPVMPTANMNITKPDEKPEEMPLLIEYPLPEWSVWMQNWKPGLMAPGINEKGLMLLDPERYPHLMFAGTSGAGKTRFGARSVVACALASGWVVVIAGKELDYKPFSYHPNAHMVPYSLLKDPTRAIDLLRSVYGEIERRDHMMSQKGYSLWAQTGGPRIMVVVDEFSNLSDALEDIDTAKKKELWRWARMDTAEARKYGVHMVYALQDPTAQSIDLRIRRNTTSIVFRVKEAISSRILLETNGAEMLPDRHFLAGMVKLERGVGFAPTDEEIIQFLSDHAVPVVEPPAWIEGKVLEEPKEKNEPLSYHPVLEVKPDVDTQIRNVLLRMKRENKVSLSQAIREVFGQQANTGGSNFGKVQKIWMDIQANETTTTKPATTDEMPNLGPVAA